MCAYSDSQEFVSSVFWFFTLQWAMCSSLEKQHIKEYIIIIIAHRRVHHYYTALETKLCSSQLIHTVEAGVWDVQTKFTKKMYLPDSALNFSLAMEKVTVR